MSNKLTRRALIASAPAAGIAMTAIPSRAAAPIDPVPGLVAEWRKARAAFGNEPSDDEKVHDALYQKMGEAERRILTTKPTSAAGIVAQLEYALTDELIGGELHGDFEGLDGRMFRQMIEALRLGALTA